jgi:hypothetical protein
MPDDGCYADDIDASSRSTVPMFQVEDGVEVAAQQHAMLLTLLAPNALHFS